MLFKRKIDVTEYCEGNLKALLSAEREVIDNKRFRIFATSRIGDPAENRLRERGYDLEVFQGPRSAAAPRACSPRITRLAFSAHCDKHLRREHAARN
jgi:hypothetical protein